MIVTRCLPRSLLLGLVLAGLRPVWVLPERDPETGLPAAVAVRTVRGAGYRLRAGGSPASRS